MNSLSEGECSDTVNACSHWVEVYGEGVMERLRGEGGCRHIMNACSRWAVPAFCSATTGLVRLCDCVRQCLCACVGVCWILHALPPHLFSHF